ncbi:hypothetical protein FACS1894163_03220 [Spirochaetia bacterium]|nr:hypothetical protein FACS1894163_03220 [Spirochaetia bacterium]
MTIMSPINKVIVVFKTHLDIGFTALAVDVLKKYRTSFIPEAVKMAFKSNTGKKCRFTWTVGSFLIHHFLDSSDVPVEQKARLEEALRLGHVRWHALACTTHTELMDAALFRYNLSLSKNLDARYGKKTIAAKMTDVPGHTIAIVPAMAEAGVEYLHIGVNAACRVPEVPELFRWRFQGSELVMNYAGVYGSSTALPNGVALEFAHSNDNDGPPSEAYLDVLYQRLAEKYPGADIQAGSLDDFALAIREVRDTLPVVEEEIGDTWIHGISSDPIKTGQFKKLLRLKDGWLKQNLLESSNDIYKKFMDPLLLIAEHTWGMNTQRHLQDFTNWTKRDFQKARVTDFVAVENLSSKNHQVQSGLPNLPPTAYSKFEASHQEQRDYIKAAITALPRELAAEAAKELETMGIAYPGGSKAAMSSGSRKDSMIPIQLGDWIVTVGKTGELENIKNISHNLDRTTAFGLYSYELFDGKTVDDSLYGYARDLNKHWNWIEPDFGKAGLRYEANIKVGRYTGEVSSINADDRRLIITLRMAPWLSEEYGCPRETIIEHLFDDDSITTHLYLAKKDAIRNPEALWFSMDFKVANPNRWQMIKMGQTISPLNVVRGGNRQLHAVEELRYTAADGALRIKPGESPTVSFSGYSLYDVSKEYSSMDGSVNFLLYNNRWGTNFKQWFEEDLRFSYRTEFMMH